MKCFQLFRITGVANAITYDAGLKSSAGEPKRIVACHVQMALHAGSDDNEIQGYHERAKVFDIPEKMFPAEATADTTSDVSETRSKVIPVELDIPTGETFKIALNGSASDTQLRGMYEYEII